MPNREDEKKLDKELKDTFPASDPTSGNIFVGAPDAKELKDSDEECCCGHSHHGMKNKTSK